MKLATRPWFQLMIGAIFISLLGLCSCTRPPSQPKPESEPIGSDTIRRNDTLATIQVQPDTSYVLVEPHRSLIDKVFNRTPKAERYPVGTAVKAGKKSTITINNVTGGQVNTSTTVGKKAVAATAEGATATSIGKAKGPTAIGDSAAAIDNTKAGQRGGAAALGPGATATATTVKGGWPWWVYALIASGVAYGGIKLYKRFAA